MDNLIQIIQTQIGTETVNAREVYKYLELADGQFSRWIKLAIEKYDFTENEDFNTIDMQVGATLYKDYIVTLDMAKELCMVSDTLKGKEVRKYFIKVEKQANKPLTVEQVLALNAKMIDDLKNKVIKLEYSNVVLEETKAEINNKKTATAMNTASQLSKKNSKLEIQLDESKSYTTIKRMSEIYGTSFNWRELKRVSKKLDLKSKDVFDSNYGTVKAYHREVWKKAYSLGVK